MKTGGILALIGGILSLVACFLLSFYGGYGLDGWGTGVLMNAGFWLDVATLYGYPLLTAAVIIFSILIFGGVLQIIGIKSRATAIIGAIFSLVLAIFLILAISGTLPLEITIMASTFAGPTTIPGLPLHVALGDYGLGIFVLLGGGVLAFVGGILPRD